jgi:hypothetical protein
MQNLGIALGELGELRASREVFERVLARRLETLAPDTPLVISARKNYAIAVALTGDLEAARAEELRIHAQQRPVLAQHGLGRRPGIEPGVLSFLCSRVRIAAREIAVRRHVQQSHAGDSRRERRLRRFSTAERARLAAVPLGHDALHGRSLERGAGRRCGARSVRSVTAAS